MDLKEILYLLEKENPNSIDLGNKVRSLVWKMKEEQSKSITDEQLPGQITIFDEIKEANDRSE